MGWTTYKELLGVILDLAVNLDSQHHLHELVTHIQRDMLIAVFHEQSDELFE